MDPEFPDLGAGKEARIEKMKREIPEFNDPFSERLFRTYAELVPPAVIANAHEAATARGVRNRVGLAISVVKKAAGR